MGISWKKSSHIIPIPYERHSVHSSRIKSFSLSEAIIYSYLRDIRFVLLICLLIGFTAWWAEVPQSVFYFPWTAQCSEKFVAVEQLQISDAFRGRFFQPTWEKKDR